MLRCRTIPSKNLVPSVLVPPTAFGRGPLPLMCRGRRQFLEGIVLPLRYINFVIINLFCVYFVYFGGEGAVGEADAYAVSYVDFVYGL